MQSQYYYPQHPQHPWASQAGPAVYAQRTAGIFSDVVDLGYRMSPMGTLERYWSGDRKNGGSGSGGGGGWGTTLVLAGIVGVGVVGYLFYRNFIISEAAVRGAFGEED